MQITFSRTNERYSIKNSGPAVEKIWSAEIIILVCRDILIGLEVLIGWESFIDDEIIKLIF